MNLPSKIVIGSDHAGFEYKEAIKQYLVKNNVEIIDVGTHSTESCDYPDYTHFDLRFCQWRSYHSQQASGNPSGIVLAK